MLYSKKTISTILTICLTVVLCSVVGAQVPNTISYQGIIATPGTPPVPLDGPNDLTFNIYDVSTGGSTLWTETHAAVDLEDGRFSVILGSTTSLSSLGFDTQYWLGITVGAGTEVGRFEFTALNSKSVEDGAITRPKIASSAVGSQEIGNYAVTDLDLASNAVTAAKIAQNGATTGQVLKWNGSDWAAADDETGAGVSPVAFGAISSDGTVNAGWPAGISASWNASTDRYEVTIPGVNYVYYNFATSITPIGGGTALAATTGSIGGKLTVRLTDAAHAAVLSQLRKQIIKYSPQALPPEGFLSAHFVCLSLRTLRVLFAARWSQDGCEAR